MSAIPTLTELAPVAPVATEAPLRALSYENLVMSMLYAVADRVGAQIRSASSSAGVRFWAVDIGKIVTNRIWIIGPSDREVVIEIRHHVLNEPSRADAFHQRLEIDQTKAGHVVDSLLLITREPLPEAFERRFAEYSDMFHVLVKTSEDTPKLEQALRTALESKQPSQPTGCRPVGS